MDAVTIMDGLLISLSGTTIVLAILTVVVFLLEGLGRFVNRFEQSTPVAVATPQLTPAVVTPTPAPIASLPITDEERVIVALVAGIAAEESDPTGSYHIGSITRTR